MADSIPEPRPHEGTPEPDVPLDRWTPEGTLDVSFEGVPLLYEVKVDFLRHPDGNHFAFRLADLLDLSSEMPTDTLVVLPIDYQMLAEHIKTEEPPINLVFDNGRVCLNRGMHQLELDGIIINMSKTEFNLLEYLMLNPNRTRTKEQIFKAVWTDASAGYYSNNAIETYISYVRKKLGPERSWMIQTRFNIGYAFSDIRSEEKSADE